LTVIDHRQQPSLKQTKKQPNNQLLTLATLLLNDICHPVIDTALSEVDCRFGGANRNIMCGIGALNYSWLWPISRVQRHNKVRGAVQVRCRPFSARVEIDEAYDRAQNSWQYYSSIWREYFYAP